MLDDGVEETAHFVLRNRVGRPVGVGDRELDRIGPVLVAPPMRELRRLESEHRIEPLSILPAMGRMAAAMVHDVLNAFAARDPEAALAVCESDNALDDFYDSIFRTLVTYMVENPKTISECAQLLFVAKNLERIGDHATNMVEMVYFAATGTRLVEREKGVD